MWVCASLTRQIAPQAALLTPSERCQLKLCWFYFVLWISMLLKPLVSFLLWLWIHLLMSLQIFMRTFFQTKRATWFVVNWLKCANLHCITDLDLLAANRVTSALHADNLTCVNMWCRLCSRACSHAFFICSAPVVRQQEEGNCRSLESVQTNWPPPPWWISKHIEPSRDAVGETLGWKQEDLLSSEINAVYLLMIPQLAPSELY